MSGKIIVVCGACQKKLGVPETASGKRIRCPGCSEPISVPVNSAAPPSKAGTERRYADPIDDDLFGGDAYGDDLYGDETSGRQLPSVKRKKKSSSSSSSGSAKSSGGFLSSYEGQRIRAMGTGFLMMAGAAVWFI